MYTDKRTLLSLQLNLLSLMLFICLSGCRITLQSKKISKVLSSDYCAQTYNDGPMASYQNNDSLILVMKDVPERLTANEIQLANSIGILSQIISRSNLNDGSGSANMIKIKELDFDIENRISFASNIISDIAAEIHCESQRTSRIVDYLDDLGRKRVNKLTVGAIFSGAVTGIAPILIKDQKIQNALVITGSAISAGLGIAALTSNRKKVEFRYSRNLLGDIWYRPEISKDYPAFLWLMLKRPKDDSQDSSTSVAGALKKRWIKLEFNNNVDKHIEDLQFGKGGVFEEDELNTRQVLLNQLEAEIQLLNIKLVALSRKLKTY